MTDGGFTIESRMPVIDLEWEVCKMHGHTPKEGFTMIRACRIASSLLKMMGQSGPEIQIRVIARDGTVITTDSNRK